MNRPDVETARKEDFKLLDGEKPYTQNDETEIHNDDDSVKIQNAVDDDNGANE